jgi:membrane protease YdiL (CAAX protease family)
MTSPPTPPAYRTAVELSHPHAEPHTYPLMLRTWTYAWWKPVVGLVALVAGMLVVVPFALLPLLAAVVAVDHTGSFSKAFEDALSLDHVTWQGMLYLNLALAGLVPVTWLIIRYVHRMRPRWLMSVRPGIRWGFFWACLGLAPVAMFAQLVLGAILPSDPNNLDSSPNHLTGRLVAIGLVVLFTTPLQAIGEEYAFRGYAMQAFGALTRRPWIAILLSATLFALAHGVQNAPLFLDRLAFGLMAGYVVLRTGGLEAGIAMHVWNNLVAFGFALLLGSIDDSLNVTEISWWNIPLTITQNGVYLVLVLLVARSMGIGSRTTPPVVPPTGSPVLLPTTPRV